MVVYYKAAEKYKADYFKSIVDQTSKAFDLLIIYDNIQPLKISGLNVEIFEMIISSKMTPSKIRFEGIKYAFKNGYKNIVFSDIDDYFSNNRIEVTINNLARKKFVVNRVEAVNHKKEIIQMSDLSLLVKNENLKSYKQLLDYNTHGLTHTGINIESIESIYIPEEILATDWWIFTTLMLQGYTGKYVSDATTYYRQSEDNLVGIQKPLDENRLFLGLRVKAVHYKHMVDYCRRLNFRDARDDYIARAKEMKDLSTAIQDQGYRTKYIDTINRKMQLIYKGWWSEILTLTQWRMYET